MPLFSKSSVFKTPKRKAGVFKFPRFEQRFPKRQRPLARLFHPQLWLAHLNLSAQIQMDQSESSGRCRRPDHNGLRKAEEANCKADLSFFTSLSTAEAHVLGVKFIGPYGTIGFISIWDFSFWGESDLWSDVWPAMDGVICGLPFHSFRRKSNGFTGPAERIFKWGGG